MLLTLTPLIAKLGMMLLEYFASQKVLSDESKVIFIKMAEELRKMGAINIKSRYEAERQIDSNDAEWTKRETDIKKDDHLK